MGRWDYEIIEWTATRIRARSEAPVGEMVLTLLPESKEVQRTWRELDNPTNWESYELK